MKASTLNCVFENILAKNALEMQGIKGSIAFHLNNLENASQQDRLAHIEALSDCLEIQDTIWDNTNAIHNLLTLDYPEEVGASRGTF